MRLVSFEHQGERYGVLRDGDRLADLTDHCGQGIRDLASALGRHGVAGLAEIASGQPSALGLDEVELLPPIPNPGKIICVGLNYRSHIAETGLPVPSNPMLFARFANSVVGHGAPLVRPLVSDQFDFEGELAVVIGRSVRHTRREDALGYVAGYSCFNDGSLRDYQLQTSQFLPGKMFWRSGAFGPWLVTADEISEPSTLSLETRLNGVAMQRATLDDLLFDIPMLISHISSITALEPGDVIVTGTTGGVGMARTPPIWMRPGDKVEVHIDGIGTLANSVRDEAEAG